MAFSRLASTRAEGVIERFLTQGDLLAADGGEIRVPSYRVNVSAAGIHVYNRHGMTTATDPFDLNPRLDLRSGCSMPT